MRLMKGYLFLKEIIRVPFVIIHLIRKPNDIEPIFKLKSFSNHGLFRLSLETLMKDPESAARIKERYLSKESPNLNALKNLPKNTLGYAFYKFITDRNLEIDFYPELNGNDDDATYVRRRGRQTHDIWHTVTGIGSDQAGEMKLSAIYVAQIYSPFNALFLLIGMIYCLFKQPHRLREYFDAVAEGWIMARTIRPLFGAKWELMWDRPLQDIRQEWGIPVVPQGISSIPNFTE